MWDRFVTLKPIAKKGLQVLGSLLIAYVFVIVLMTATSQAGVAGRLSRLANPIDYSTGYANWQESREEDRIRQTQGRITELAEQHELAMQAERNTQDNYLNALGPLLALQPRLRAAPACEFDATATAPDEIAGTLSRIRACLADANLPLALKTEASELASSETTLAAGREWRFHQRRMQALERQLNDARAELSTLLQARTALDGAFSELAVVQRNWALGGGVLAELPPSMIQILLAFVSGMFGALLLTLVLIVYPKNSLRLTSTAGGYGSRVLLGGLISLCVFVVLGGGTAVLGTSNSFASGETNFLAFCAIGILAGMFSDRVASWLSERADTFFKSEAERSQPGGDRNDRDDRQEQA